MPHVEPSIVLIGKEGAGKSQLVTSLTGATAYSSNFRGSTIVCESYRADGKVFVDTPGILTKSDTATTIEALNRLAQSDVVLLVVQATQIDEDLADLLPLAQGRDGAVVVTFWDKLSPNHHAINTLNRVASSAKLDFIPIDARHLTRDAHAKILAAMDHPRPITCRRLPTRAGWRIQPRRTPLEDPHLGPVLAVALLLVPALAAVLCANALASVMDPLVQGMIGRVARAVWWMPEPPKDLLTGRYGLITMGPLMLVWAVPTVILYALLLGSYKASGLLDRATSAVHPLVRPFGLNGRDLVRVIMGFGCNVPAVISTRACSSCARETCIAAIAFGAACSYQLGATLAVFSKAGKPLLVIPFLLYLTATTLIYVRLSSPVHARSRQNQLMIIDRVFLSLPTWSSVWNESRSMLVHFFRRAMPIFLAITIIASLLDTLGITTQLGFLLSPAMGIFRLPSETALPVVLASIRKDGILLFTQDHLLSTLSSWQLLTGVYLAGVLLPCLVTCLTIAREVSAVFAFRLVLRQALAGSTFALLLAWVGALFRS
jgi:Fe2+ transport system protein B